MYSKQIKPKFLCHQPSKKNIINFHYSFYKIVFLSFIIIIKCSSSQDDVTTTTTTSTINSDSTRANNNKDSETINRYRANEALELLHDWSSRFGNDIYHGTQQATCFDTIRKQYDPSILNPIRREDYKASIVYNDWTRENNEIVNIIGKNMDWHKEAVEHIATASEYLAGNHTFDKNLHFDYIDVHRLQNIDDEQYISENDSNLYSTDVSNLETNSTITNNNTNQDSLDSLSNDGNLSNQEIAQFNSDSDPTNSNSIDANSMDQSQKSIEPLPKAMSLINQASSQQQDQQQTSSIITSTSEWQTPIKYLKLSKHKNFDEVLINTDESSVHIPVHIFPAEPQVMNGIAWSESLTKIFKDNFVRNPKLTNQYFASQNGFLRLFPAQQWQIPRMDPDLYDARMRPWYVAGASSRKDVVILVDSSGSMTGSRRDIAKGVVFEILDTLTDNDHFLILKFSDSIQQVGVPSCSKMRVKKKTSSIPLKNTLFNYDLDGQVKKPQEQTSNNNNNETDINSLYMLPATGKYIRHIKTNFTIATSGIANFSRALVTAFEVLRNYQDSEQYGIQCNQAIMLITDGSPSNFEEIFNRYNYPNAPVRVFTYLIGREAGDVGHTKMMACHNRGYYTHVINLAEVRETVQQYIPVMARPLVLSKLHPINWTPAYGELTYQILTDWIWESKRRDKVRAILAANGRGSPSNSIGYNSNIPNIRVTTSDDGSNNSPSDENYDSGYSGSGSLEDNNQNNVDDQMEAIDLFGYNNNIDCFWETRHNDLLTTVVQPVYDNKNESVVTEKFLLKNVWTVKETIMRTAQILGVAAADMKINDIIALAPSHKLGPNGYAIMLTNNGYIMHHPDLRSILEPFSSDPSEKNMRILKPFFSSLDFTQVEHISNPSSDDDKDFLALRHEAIAGLTGWRELETKRTIDCQKRVQSRKQSFYYKPIKNYPFSFMIAIPQSYGLHRIEAQIEIKIASLPEKLTTYFTTSDYDIWTVHPKYQYCDGPSNNTITTLLDVFQKVEAEKLDDIQWKAAESQKPPLYVPNKIVCDKDLLQSLVYDAVATFGFSDKCSPPDLNSEQHLLSMFGARFSFIATRNGLTRVRHFDADDLTIKKEAFVFAKKYSRGVDETFYKRTVDYNMLYNDSATLVQVPFNTYEKIRDSFSRYELDLALNSDKTTSDLNIDNNNNQDNLAITNNNSNNNIQQKLYIKDMDLMEKLQVLTNTSIHMIATQSISVNEGSQKAIAGVTGVFYDYATFVIRFFNLTNSKFNDGKPIKKPAACYSDNPTDAICDDSKMVKCGLSNDTIDCLLIDNNGYIIVSENLEFIGKHLKAYDSIIMEKLIKNNVFYEVNITDYQAVCIRNEEKQQPTSSSSFGRRILFDNNSIRPSKILLSLVGNIISVFTYTWTLMISTISTFNFGQVFGLLPPLQQQQQSALTRQQLANQPMLSLLPNKTYLRPCKKTLKLYETLRSNKTSRSEKVEYYSIPKCDCNSWFIYEQVPYTNLIMIIVDSSLDCKKNCLIDQYTTSAYVDPTDPIDENYINTEEQVCSMLERETQLYRKKIDSCFSHHPEEEYIKICGGASKTVLVNNILLIILLVISLRFTTFQS